MDKWQSNLNSLQKPSMEKPTYTDSYADRIAAMEQAGTPVYNSKYQQQIDALLDQVAGRGSFNYDVSSDPLYQAYKNQYVQGGRLAMQDTMGQAAALTGGYGSSYASTAGNQAYQQYLGGLNDQLLNLQSNALARYEAEGNRLQNLLGNYQNQESSDYNRYRDQVGDYYDKLNALRQGQSNGRTATTTFNGGKGVWQGRRRNRKKKRRRPARNTCRCKALREPRDRRPRSGQRKSFP